MDSVVTDSSQPTQENETMVSNAAVHPRHEIFRIENLRLWNWRVEAAVSRGDLISRELLMLGLPI